MLVFDATRSLLSDVLVQLPLSPDWSISWQVLATLCRGGDSLGTIGNGHTALLSSIEERVGKNCQKIPSESLVAEQKLGCV